MIVSKTNDAPWTHRDGILDGRLGRHGSAMGKGSTPEEQLEFFIAKYSPEITAIANAVLTKMRSRYSHSLELV